VKGECGKAPAVKRDIGFAEDLGEFRRSRFEMKVVERAFPDHPVAGVRVVPLNPDITSSPLLLLGLEDGSA
jgi:hypothetical protein